ncbi:MAG: biotin synthase [Desulforhopalus sp.]|jgi:biotin synthase
MFNLKEIYELLQGKRDTWLFGQASLVTHKQFGKNAYLRAIVEFSSYCQCNCHYCGLRKANRNLNRYRLSKEDIVLVAVNAAEMGFATVVLQGGEDPAFQPEDFAEIIAEIKKQKNVTITLSLGQYSYNALALWRNAGADRYLLKIETSNSQLFTRYRPGYTLDERLQCLEDIRTLGYETGSGIIVGLPPGQRDPLTLLTQDIHFLNSLNLDMIAVGPFIPHPKTPLKDASYGNIALTHRTQAILRLSNPAANIPATTAMDAMGCLLTPGSPTRERQKALGRGCNVLMEAAPLHLAKGSYEIYPAKKRHAHPFQRAKNIITAAGKTLSAH